MMKEWLSSNPINAEDMLRHDKWCAMMWPRLTLLRELLSNTGSFWMTIDDNEMANAKSLLDEIFGVQLFVATCIWHKNYSPKPSAQFFSEDHDLGLPPWLRQTVKTFFAVRCKNLDRQDHFIAF